jgi:hypothetical protein
MRIDFEDLRIYTNINHLKFDNFSQDSYLKNLTYYEDTGRDDMWFYKSSPYHIFEIAHTRDSGLYEILYDYVKRHVDRGRTVFDYGAGIGTLEVLLLKRYPAALSAEETNLLCMDFIFWRMHRRNAALAPPTTHYDYVVSIDTLQRLPPEFIKRTLNWLLSLGDRCFFYMPVDNRYQFYNKIPFDVEEYLKGATKEVSCYHGLWDVKMI